MPNRKMVPNLIVAGVTKAGTTSIFRYLSEHPQVCSSYIKETCHFLPLRYNEPQPPISDYAYYFLHCSRERLIVESTPGYFNGGMAVAGEIGRCLPNVKIVIVFRDPIKRLISHFHYMKSLRKLNRDLSLNDYIKHCESFTKEELRLRVNDPWFGLEGGKYADYLEPWIETFGRSLKITFFENMIDNPICYLQELSEFANIDPEHFEIMEFQQENKTRDYKNMWLHELALKTYLTLAPSLNRYPNIKQKIRSVYGKINEKPIHNDTTESQQLEDRLAEYYAPSKAALRAQLSALPMQMVSQSLPDWLTEP